MNLYRYLDRVVDDLPVDSRGIVRAMRRWVAAARSGRCPCAAIARVLGVAGDDDAVAHFNMMMATLDHESVRVLRFAERGAACVSDDEAAVLTLCDAAMQGDDFGVYRMAASLVADAGRSRLALAATLLTATLAARVLPQNSQDQ